MLNGTANSHLAVFFLPPQYLRQTLGILLESTDAGSCPY